MTCGWTSPRLIVAVEVSNFPAGHCETDANAEGWQEDDSNRANDVAGGLLVRAGGGLRR
jgi:hypothetical protein